MSITLPRNTIMAWEEERVSDHGRAALSISPTQIETKNRMVDGTMRKNSITVKNTYSASWENLPSTDAHAVDGFMAADSMYQFYLAHQGAFTLTLTYDGSPGDTLVMFSSFSYEISKRGTNGIDLVNISVELEEV